MSTTTHNARRGVVCLVAALLSALALTAPAASAHDGWPAHQLGALTCNQGSVTVRAPVPVAPVNNVNYANPELIEWWPDLYVWDGRNWQPTARSGVWYQALTTSFGFARGWRRTNSAAITFGHVFPNQVPGYYYTVVHSMRWTTAWGTGVVHADWHPGYCMVS